MLGERGQIGGLQAPGPKNREKAQRKYEIVMIRIGYLEEKVAYQVTFETIATALIGSWVPPHAPHIGSSSFFERLLVATPCCTGAHVDFTQY
jgi:hypothetical protein